MSKQLSRSDKLLKLESLDLHISEIETQLQSCAKSLADQEDLLAKSKDQNLSWQKEIDLWL
jgi:hypothetical protein